jgi:hypothetical protein
MNVLVVYGYTTTTVYRMTRKEKGDMSYRCQLYFALGPISSVINSNTKCNQQKISDI